MDLRKENALVEALYDAALGHRSWMQVSQDLLTIVDAQTMMLSIHHPGGAKVDVLGWLGMSSEALQGYAQFARYDVWAAGIVEQRLFGRAVIGSHLVDDQTLTESLIYNEYLLPTRVGVYHILGTVAPMAGGYQTLMGAHRSRDNRDFSLDEANRFQRLLPHIQRAMEVRLRLQQAEQASRSVFSALDRLSMGVIMLGATGRLIHVNAAADAILQGADGLMRTANGLRAANKDDDKRLQGLISGLRHSSGDARSAGGHLRVRRFSGRRAYAVMLTPVGVGVCGGSEAPAILVFVSDPSIKVASDLAVLTELFGFPPAEGRLVLALLSGMSPPEFARQSGVTYNTAKTLLARALARTDSRSQLELVLLVAGSLSGISRALGVQSRILMVHHRS